ncbi:MAG: YtxH domain-containing protein [Xanthomarina sp.]
MKKQQGNGLLALLGIGAGVYAWWKYKNMSPEKKEELHNKVNEVGQKVKDTYNDVESTVKNKFDELKDGAQKGLNDLQNEVKETKY